jgi:hypothetical protein
VPHAVSLGVEIMLVVLMRLHGDGQVFHYVQPVTGKALNLQGVIGEKSQMADTEIS